MIWPRRTFLVVLLLTVLLSMSDLNGEEKSSSSTVTTTEDDDSSTITESPTITPKEGGSSDATSGESDSNSEEDKQPVSDDQHAEKGPADAKIVTENGRICLAVNFDAQFALEKKTKHTSMLEQLNSTGTCDDEKGEYSITLRWKGFNLTIVANKTNSDWQMKSLELHFKLSEVSGDKQDGTWKTLHANSSDLEIFSASVNQSVSCASKEIELYDKGEKSSASIVLVYFTMQIYNVSSTYAPSKSCEQLTAEPVVQTARVQSDTAPIAVGSTLAILTLAVITGYAIYRSLTNKKVDYGNIGGE